MISENTGHTSFKFKYVLSKVLNYYWFEDNLNFDNAGSWSRTCIVNGNICCGQIDNKNGRETTETKYYLLFPYSSNIILWYIHP